MKGKSIFKMLVDAFGIPKFVTKQKKEVEPAHIVVARVEKAHEKRERKKQKRKWNANV